MAATHTSPYCGSWYPPDEAGLNRLLDQLFEGSLDRTGPWLLPDAIGLVAPHAAPVYSGMQAAAAYRHLQAAQPRRVFVLGFSHRARRRGVAIPELARYRTPLGDVDVDVAAARDLAAHAPFGMVDEAEICDHSIEIQLPFLRRAVPGIPVLPLCVGELTATERAQAAERLAGIRRPGDVLLASSDLAHYGRDFDFQPFPPDGRAPDRLRAIDSRSIEAAGAIDAAWFLRETGDRGGTPCGRAPIALLLETLPLLGGPDVYQEELDYQTSGDITGDFSLSVSYAALGYFPRRSFELGESARAALLESAAATLRRFRQTGGREIVLAPDEPELARRAAVFVTLFGPGGLIGCIGRVPGGGSLREAVPDLALAAALDDPRNPRPGSIPRNATVDISVLTPLRRIAGSADLRVRVDGAILECGSHRGLLLPQAAREWWTADEFVSALCRKAGLPAGVPPAGARLFRFQAQVFGGGLATSPARA